MLRRIIDKDCRHRYHVTKGRCLVYPSKPIWSERAGSQIPVI